MNNNQINQENSNEVEVWRPAVGYEKTYEVSNLGKVRSIDRFVIRKNFMFYFRKGKILKLRIGFKGYQYASLWGNKKNNKPKVHRLIAQAFIPNPNNLPQVNHKNNNKLDNRVENLEWITNLDNIRHAWKNGFKNNNHCIGEKNHFAKLTSESVREIRNSYKELNKLNLVSKKSKRIELAEKFNITERCIRSIVYNEVWKHVII